MPLTDLNLQPVYDHSNCPDLLNSLYEPLLAQAIRYDRTTYTFSANGLATAAAGTAGMVRNGGHIRLICDWSVEEPTLKAIEAGKTNPDEILRHRLSPEELLRTQGSNITQDHLELATWLVANDIMEVKVAIRPDHIFHGKSGIVEDKHGNRIAFSGSLNETESGWSHNWESIDVFTEPDDRHRIDARENEFQALWSNQAKGLHVIELPDFYRQYIVEHAPSTPSILRPRRQNDEDAAAEYWNWIRAGLASDPDSTAATVPTTLWPHQERFRQQNVGDNAIRRLIADEVGLGKTLQAGIILKTRLNQGKATRALIIAPKAALKQWQSELLTKFAIDAPIIDSQGQHYREGTTLPPAEPPWNAPLALVSHQWLVRNRTAFLSDCGDYDLIIVDEAHRARFRDVDHPVRRTPNEYLKLLQQLCRRSRDLLLLTATPMQLNEVELWALLELLEPEGWNTPEYQAFYQEEPPDLTDLKYRRDLWLKTDPPAPDNLLLTAGDAYVAERMQDPTMLQEALDEMHRSAPAKRLMSWHTRELLRQYRDRGLLDMPVPQRQAHDLAIRMSPEERRLYEGIAELVTQAYESRGITRQALGFINTVFRKRLGSSTYAYAQTLRNAANRITAEDDEWTTTIDDADLDEDANLDADVLNRAANAEALRRAADRAEELSHHDTKRRRLRSVIADLKGKGHSHILMFTQFRDTQSWLAEHLQHAGHYVTSLHGQDAHLGDRAERLRQFRQQPEGILLCTETASESLNLQFCTAVVNYDVPWNPMTLEQRAGRIDRIGQERPVVDVVNLFYTGTAEHDAYEAVARRFESIRANVGEYPPIIAAGIQRIIREEANPETELALLVSRTDFDINRLNAEWDAPNTPINPRVTVDDLERPLREPELMPPRWFVHHRGGKHWDVTNPQGDTVRVTTDAEAYQRADGRLQWWQGPNGSYR